MWLAVSHDGGTAVQHRLLKYIDDRAANATRWITAMETYPGPTLFIWGPADPISGVHVIPRLRERMPRADVVTLDDAPATGHHPQVENPAAVLAALTPFLTAAD